METYLECQMPEDLAKHLFLSFIKRPASVAKLRAGAGSRPLTPLIGRRENNMWLYIWVWLYILDLAKHLFLSFIKRPASVAKLRAGAGARPLSPLIGKGKPMWLCKWVLLYILDIAKHLPVFHQATRLRRQIAGRYKFSPAYAAHS